MTPTLAARHGRRLAAAVALLALAALPALTGCGSSASAGAKDPVRIGASLSLSGGDNEIGKVYQNAINLEISLLNARGAVPGRKLEVVYKDDGSNPTTAVANIRAFQSDDNIAAVITGPCDDCVTQATSQINKSKMPVISLAPSSLQPTNTTGTSALFKLTPNVNDSTQALVDEMVLNHVTKVALLVEDSDYGTTATGVARGILQKAGLTLTNTITLGATPDGAVQTVTGGGDKPDAVLTVASATASASVASLLNQNGFQGGLYLDSLAANNLFLSGLATAEEGAYLAYPQVMAMDDLVASTPAKASEQQWFDSYTSQYGSFAGPSAFAADAVQLVGMAATATRSVDRAKLRSAMETTQFAGLSGLVQITPINHSGLTPRSVVVLRAVNGRWHQLTAG